MSPQSRATNNTTFDDGWSGNSCSGTSSVAELARAANMEYSLHKIESVGSTSSTNPPAHQDTACGADASQQLRKRSATCMSSPPKNQPFLSSYGSAFLSGIFADIAQAGDDQPENAPGASHDGVDPSAVSTANDDVCEPFHKKARTTASTSFGRQPKSYMALTGLVEGAVSEVSSPSVVSPRPNTSTVQIFNDQVRELQDMAFPSLPQIPITVSSSSCSTASQNLSSPRELTLGEATQDVHDGPSYGWFVSTDGDESDSADLNEPSASMFLPDTKPDLAFKAITAPNMGDQDLEVQQALAADTIDDVLGDLF